MALGNLCYIAQAISRSTLMAQLSFITLLYDALFLSEFFHRLSLMDNDYL